MRTDKTFELGLGGGTGLGLGLGVGGWVTPKLALTARVAAFVLPGAGSNVFLGPAVQYWVTDHFWFGGGAGLGVLNRSDDSYKGQGGVLGGSVDVRAGYTFNAGTENTLNVAFECNPGVYPGITQGTHSLIPTFGVLLGYQYL